MEKGNYWERRKVLSMGQENQLPSWEMPGSLAPGFLENMGRCLSSTVSDRAGSRLVKSLDAKQDEPEPLPISPCLHATRALHSLMDAASLSPPKSLADSRVRNGVVGNVIVTQAILCNTLFFFFYYNPLNWLFVPIKAFSFPSLQELAHDSLWLWTLNCNSLLIPDGPILAGEISSSQLVWGSTNPYNNPRMQILSHVHFTVGETEVQKS